MSANRHCPQQHPPPSGQRNPRWPDDRLGTGRRLETAVGSAAASNQVASRETAVPPPNPVRQDKAQETAVFSPNPATQANAQETAVSPSLPTRQVNAQETAVLPSAPTIHASAQETAVLPPAPVMQANTQETAVSSPASKPAPSAALQAANERMLKLRAQLASKRTAAPSPPNDGRQPAAHSQPAAMEDRETALTNLPLKDLPEHLGWYSQAVTNAIRTRQPHTDHTHARQPTVGHPTVGHPTAGHPTAGQHSVGQQFTDQNTAAQPPVADCHTADQSPVSNQAQASQPASSHKDTAADTPPLPPAAADYPPPAVSTPGSNHPHHPDPSDRITFSPDLALALLRQDRVAEGRLWLLLRALDKQGRGWVAKKTAVACLTNPESPLYLCSERYLRLLLTRGEGLLWTWQQGENGRIWLRSERKVAAGLKVKLGRTVVSLPIAELLQSLGQVRAHFYASFHAGRDKDDNDKSGKPPQPPAPISRATLTDLTGASRRTQYRYERQTGIQVKANVAVGCALRETNRGEIEEQAWQYGPAWFAFTDKKGLIGPQGGRYQARQLPNSYRLSSTTTSVHRLAQRKRRRPLTHPPQPQPASPTDLRRIGDAGNGRAVKAGLWAQVAVVRRYFANGAAAAKAWRDRQLAGYWSGRPSGIWFPLPGLAL